MSNIKSEVLKTLRSEALAKINLGKKRIHSFLVDYTDIDPEFTGKITVHYPSQIERMQIGVIRSTLLGGNLDVDTVTFNIAHITATLEVVLDGKPDWFDISNPYLEYEILLAVYDEYDKWVSSFRKPAKTEPITGDSGNERSQIPMVGNEGVQGTPDGQ